MLLQIITLLILIVSACATAVALGRLNARQQAEEARNRRFRSLVVASLPPGSLALAERERARKIQAEQGIETVADSLEREVGLERSAARSLAEELCRL